MGKYLSERDDYRAGKGKRRFWKGSFLGHSHRMMGKSKGLADRAAAQRAALDKRWRWHWAREDKTCLACGDPSIGIIHPIRYCKGAEVVDSRARWTAKVEMFIRAAPPSQRPVMEDLWRCMRQEELGEYACCGIFTPDFINHLSRGGEVMTQKDKTRLNRLLREIGKGAREILRVHTGINIATRTEDLRQTSIKSFLRVAPSLPEDDSEDDEGRIRNRRKKRNTRRSQFANPVEEATEDSQDSNEEEKRIRIKNPTPTRIIIRNFLSFKRVLGRGMGSDIYWEWKAG